MTDRNIDYTELKQTLNDLGRAVQEFKETNDSALEKKANNEAVSEIEGKIERIHTDVDKFEEKSRQIQRQWEADRARIENLEQIMATGGSIKNASVLEEHTKAFFDHMREGSGFTKDALRQVEKKYRAHLPEQKQVNLGSAAAGEALVPELISAQIEQYEVKLSPIRRLIPVVNVTTTDFKQVVDLRGAGSGWVAETGTRSVTDSPTLRVRTPTWGELYARPQASEWASMDIPNMMDWLSRNVAEEFVKTEGQAVISGNGSDKPTGLFNTATATTDDDASPARNASAFEHLVAPSPDDITEHCLMLQYALKSQYRAGSKYAMNSATLGLVRRAKTSQGDYLWQPSLQAGQPSMIAGYEFEVLEDLDDVGLSPLGDPIVFGNWPRAYLLAQRSDIRMLVDPYTTIGLISWWFRRREGGIPLNNEALKVAAR